MINNTRLSCLEAGLGQNHNFFSRKSKLGGSPNKLPIQNCQGSSRKSHCLCLGLWPCGRCVDTFIRQVGAHIVVVTALVNVLVVVVVVVFTAV